MSRIRTILSLLFLLAALGLPGAAMAADEHAGDAASEESGSSDDHDDSGGDEHAGDAASDEDDAGDEHAGDAAD